VTPYAYAVEYGKGLRALFMDYARAAKFAVQSHGVIKPLYERPPE
jgi:hypothetical protein